MGGGMLLFVLLSKVLPSMSFTGNNRIGLVGRYTPDTLPTEITSLLTSELVTLAEDGSPVPSLASAWETPDKGKTWTFLLSDTTWQDGSVLSADSINLSFDNVDVTTPDEKTITFSLKEQFVPFPAALARPVFKKGLLGTRNWQVKNISLTGTYVKELDLLNQDTNEKKVYKIYPTVEQAKLAFKLGKIDEIHDVLDPTPFDTWNNVSTDTTIQSSQVVTIFFNTKDKYLSDKSLRQALSYAIDKNTFGDRAISPIAPTSWAYNPQVKPYDYDAVRAKEIITDLPKESREGLVIKIISSPTLLSVAERIAADWKAIGIESAVQVSSVIPDDFQAYVAIYDIPRDPDQYTLWHSKQSQSNLSQYSNQRIDKLLEDGRVTLDIEERRRIYLDFQRFLLEDAPAVFLYHPTYFSIHRGGK
jgi:peptide/nickel transport system substrate-binding protein